MSERIQHSLKLTPELVSPSGCYQVPLTGANKVAENGKIDESYGWREHI